MKALVYTTQAKMDGRKVIEPGKCELLDIPEPQLLPTDDMKIRVDYCAMCATDVHIVTMGLYGMPAPWVMGHELCGTIVEVNPRATENGFAVGDKVDAKVTSIDAKTRKVSLSIKAREIDEEKEALSEFGSTDSGASLGDILGAAIAKKEAEKK